MRYFEKRSGYCVFFRYLFQRREYNPLIIHLDRISLLFGGVMRFFPMIFHRGCHIILYSL